MKTTGRSNMNDDLCLVWNMLKHLFIPFEIFFEANWHILSDGNGNQDVGSRQHWNVGSPYFWDAQKIIWSFCPSALYQRNLEKNQVGIKYCTLSLSQLYSYTLKGTLQRYQYNCHVQLVFWNLLVSIKVLFDPIGWGGPAPRQRRAAEASGPVT